MIRENEIAKVVVDASLEVHRILGPGLLEGVYQAALAVELEERGLCVRRELLMPVQYKQKLLDLGYRLDHLVEDLVVLELKSVEALLPVHKKQLQTYLKLSGKRLGLILNFGSELMKNGIVRCVNGLPDE